MYPWERTQLSIAKESEWSLEVVWTIFEEEEISCPYRDWNT
jgi:hypothetical protein